jgi:transcriptional regulator with XRE-family HTH domain
VALAISEVRGIVERACARQDVLGACARRDLGTVITVLNADGLTQGQIAELTGISQGRLSEWATRKRIPRATSTFESFADGLGIPPAARQAPGLAPEAPGISGVDAAAVDPRLRTVAVMDRTDGKPPTLAPVSYFDLKNSRRVL